MTHKGNPVIGFIGVGNMGSAIVKGLISSNSVEQGNIIIFDKFNNQDDYLLSKRNDFYKNLTWFVLSIPVAFFSYANYLAYEDQEERADAIGDSRASRHAGRTKTYSQFGYYGSLFLSVTLFANAMFHLRDYIHAGQSYHDDGR